MRLVRAGTLAMLLLPAAATAQRPAGAELEELLEESWEYALRENPLLATQTGDQRFNDRLPAISEADFRRQAAAARGSLTRLGAIDRTALTPEERLNAALFERQLRDQIAETDHRGYLLALSNLGGFHTDFPQLPLYTPFRNVADYENYIARLRGFRAYAGQYIALLRAALQDGFTVPRPVLEGWEASVDPHIVADPAQSLLYKPLTDFPAAVPEAERARLQAAARSAIESSVVPGYREFQEFMREVYVPGARTEVGASALPGGRAFYAHRVKMFTTLDVTPQQVHELGLAEVRRIRGEMEQIIRQVGFTGSFAEFVEFLRTDPRFYVDTPEALMQHTALILKRIDGELPRLFGKLPRTPYGLREVPEFLAPRTTTAYYQPLSGDMRVAGFYYLNTYDLKSRPLYELEALSLHEAVPGHHLQIALQTELGEVPSFRRFSYFTAFVEGWALYAERLGTEVGFYTDPYSDFGRLTYEMWRACRLVVDTGMHEMGWTRQQAVDFMASNSALTLRNINAEVDRYIAWPGQALAYKMGELKIRELRARAEKQLGDRFDVREFHDVVLGSGSVPLTILEANVDAWLAEKRT